MDITGTPACYWLICTLYIISILQIISQPSLGGISAMQKITGHVQDTSKYLHYHWWQPVTIMIQMCLILVKLRRKLVAGVELLMIMVMSLPIGYSLMIPRSLFLFLISALPISVPINVLSLLNLILPYQGSRTTQVIILILIIPPLS